MVGGWDENGLIPAGYRNRNRSTARLHIKVENVFPVKFSVVSTLVAYICMIAAANAGTRFMMVDVFTGASLLPVA
jgi:hypothetical protein